MEEYVWDTTELYQDLGQAREGQRVQATTEHGTYLFNINGLTYDADGGITLRLKAVK